MKMPAILRSMGAETSNFQLRFHFKMTFRKCYPQHYCSFLLHLIRVTFAKSSKTKKQIQGRIQLLKDVSQKSLTCHAPEKVGSGENFQLSNVSHSQPFCVFSRNFQSSLTLSKQQLLHLFFMVFLR